MIHCSMGPSQMHKLYLESELSIMNAIIFRLIYIQGVSVKLRPNQRDTKAQFRYFILICAFYPLIANYEQVTCIFKYSSTGCPISKVPLCFACFLGFPCSYRGSFYHFSTAQETTIPKLTLLSSLYQKLIKLQSKTWSNLDLDTI